MASTTDGESETTSQRPGDPAVPEAVISPQESQPQRAPLSSAAAVGACGDEAQKRWWRRKSLKPAALAVIGVLSALGAFALYSSPSEPSAPSIATIQLKSTLSIAAILYDVTQSQVSPSIAKVTIYVQLPSDVVHAPAKAPPANLWLEAPAGISFKTCPADACRLDPNESQYIWSQALDFKYEDFDSNSGEAIATFFVKARNFGYASNDTNASAAIPRVVFLGPGSVTPILYAEYNVTSAVGYDWSTFQPELTNASEIRWDEPVTGGATQGIVTAGINQASQARDNIKTFLAGAFIGVAGGALVAALQETLPSNESRSKPQESPSGQ